MPSIFVPGAVDYGGAMARDFNAGRSLSTDALAAWRRAFEPYFTRGMFVVDVGAGTGRFAVLLAAWFDVHVIGVEPAAGMRNMAAVSGKRQGVFYIGGRAEQLPL